MNRIVIDLGFGDSGKGTLVSLLASQHPDTSLVVRYTGGCQSAHNVVMPDGRHHTFSQFGSATMQGIPTFIGPKFLFSPSQALLEAQALEALGVREPLKMLTVSNDARLVTPFHAVLNRMQESTRGVNKHGSCGHGIGVAVEYAQLGHPASAPRAYDLTLADSLATVHSKLEALKNYVKQECHRIGVDVDRTEYAHMFGATYMLGLLEKYDLFQSLVKIQFEPPASFSAGTVIFEGSQGMLLDETVGFAPHNTWSDISARNALDLIEAYNPGSDTIVHPVIRTYMTRHGAGPMPTENIMLMPVTEDKHNKESKWQDAFRYGLPDFVLWRYALDNSGCSDPPDSPPMELFITHMDQSEHIGMFADCYTHTDSPSVERRIIPVCSGQHLATYTPIFRRFPDSVLEAEDKYAALASFYVDKLKEQSANNIVLGGYTTGPCAITHHT